MMMMINNLNLRVKDGVCVGVEKDGDDDDDDDDDEDDEDDDDNDDDDDDQQLKPPCQGWGVCWR